MDEVKKTYKEVMGKQMPAFPAILAWLALKLSGGVQHVQVYATYNIVDCFFPDLASRIKDTEAIYLARVGGEYPTLDEEIELARAAGEIQDFRMWLIKRKEKQS